MSHLLNSTANIKDTTSRTPLCPTYFRVTKCIYCIFNHVRNTEALQFGLCVLELRTYWQVFILYKFENTQPILEIVYRMKITLSNHFLKSTYRAFQKKVDNRFFNFPPEYISIFTHNHHVQYFNDKIHIIGYYSGFYSSLRDKI